MGDEPEMIFILKGRVTNISGGFNGESEVTSKGTLELVGKDPDLSKYRERLVFLLLAGKEVKITIETLPEEENNE